MYIKTLLEEQEQGEGLLSPPAPNPPVTSTISSSTVGFIL